MNLWHWLRAQLTKPKSTDGRCPVESSDGWRCRRVAGHPGSCDFVNGPAVNQR